MKTRDRPIFEVANELAEFVSLGEFPTRVEELGHDSFVKRDDLSSPIYGGNKVRTLEALFAHALRQNAKRVIATGAFGSNHAAATMMHAPRVGLVPDALVFPQPPSASALANFQVNVDHSRLLRHWSTLPLGMWRERKVKGTYLMVPGGATPLGALGYVNAAFELAAQVARHELPEPRTIYVGVGSTCTSAGLLTGLILAARLKLGLTRVPHVVAVRVSPWPVTSAFRILNLACATSELLVARSGDSFHVSRSEARAHLKVDGSQLGFGYGHPTSAGGAAIAEFAKRGIKLDPTYSGKSAAAFLAREVDGPALFWSTKSTAPLPSPADDWPARVAPHAQRWIPRCEARRTTTT